MARAVIVMGAAGAAVAAHLPWAITGRTTRTGWALAGTLHRLDLDNTTALRVVLVTFLFAPVLAAGAWVAAFSGHPVLVCTLGASSGLVAGTAWALLRASPLEAEVGAHLAAASGGVALAAAAVLGCHLGTRKWRESP